MKLILGAAQFGSPYGITNLSNLMLGDSELNSLLDCAFDHGITTIDTAESYGQANQRLIEYGKKSSNKFKIINKILRLPVENTKQLKSLKESLIKEKNAFEIPFFECVMLHYAPSVNDLVTQDFLESLKADLICKKIGLSINNEDDYFLIDKKIKIDVLQAPCNILNQNIFNENLIALLESRECSIHIRSIFLQGLILATLSNVPSHLNGLNPYIIRIGELSRELGESVATLCFLFALSHDFFDKVIIGVQSKRELEELIEAYYRALDFKEKGISIEWNQFNCTNQVLVDPAQWDNLK